MAAGTHPAGTTYTWEFDGGVRIHQRQVDWVFHGRADQHVELRVVGSTDAMPKLPASTTDSDRDGAARLDQVLRDGDLAFLNHRHDEAHSHYGRAVVLANAIYHDGVAWAGRRLKEETLVEQIDHDLRSVLTSETYLGLRDWERQFPQSKIEGTWWMRYAAYAATTGRADLARRILTDLMEYAPGTKGVQELLDDLEPEAP